MKRSPRPPSRAPHPSADEVALFRAALKDAKPLRQRMRPPGGSAANRALHPDAAGEAAGRRDARLPDRERGTAIAPNPGIDRRTEERLRRGAMAIEMRLDLHGLSEDMAHRALDRFVREAWEAERRMLLVITGKGAAAEGGGVLRRNLPRWLAQGANAARVLKIAPAQPRHGGGGAYYVLLRRRRER
ncbi:MAG TPA: Smr/MutS family protein [Alphaproteobacteria bacterium]|nr:Smr/MutS family protein [Alphaproteobacteria bacterium]